MFVYELSGCGFESSGSHINLCLNDTAFSYSSAVEKIYRSCLLPFSQYGNPMLKPMDSMWRCVSYAISFVCFFVLLSVFVFIDKFIFFYREKVIEFFPCRKINIWQSLVIT